MTHAPSPHEFKLQLHSLTVVAGVVLSFLRGIPRVPLEVGFPLGTILWVQALLGLCMGFGPNVTCVGNTNINCVIVATYG